MHFTLYFFLSTNYLDLSSTVLQFFCLDRQSQNQELNRIFTIALSYMQLRHCIALEQIEKTFKSVLRHLIYCKEAQCSSQVYVHDLHWNMQRVVYSALLLLLLLYYEIRRERSTYRPPDSLFGASFKPAFDCLDVRSSLAN